LFFLLCDKKYDNRIVSDTMLGIYDVMYFEKVEVEHDLVTYEEQ